MWVGGGGGQLQSNQLQVCGSVRMSGDAAGESGFYSRLHCRNVRLFIIYQLRKMSPESLVYQLEGGFWTSAHTDMLTVGESIHFKLPLDYLWKY